MPAGVCSFNLLFIFTVCVQALLYLEEKGFPAHGSIHSGNIMLHDGACRSGPYSVSGVLVVSCFLLCGLFAHLLF